MTTKTITVTGKRGHLSTKDTFHRGPEDIAVTGAWHSESFDFEIRYGCTTAEDSWWVEFDNFRGTQSAFIYFEAVLGDVREHIQSLNEDLVDFEHNPDRILRLVTNLVNDSLGSPYQEINLALSCRPLSFPAPMTEQVLRVLVPSDPFGTLSMSDLVHGLSPSTKLVIIDLIKDHKQLSPGFQPDDPEAFIIEAFSKLNKSQDVA